jgi:hypothetical protein
MTKQFSPYYHAEELGAVRHNGGMNWSYTAFNTKEVAEQFEKDCNANGFRTRDLHDSGDGTWSVQYHHYED